MAAEGLLKAAPDGGREGVCVVNLVGRLGVELDKFAAMVKEWVRNGKQDLRGNCETKRGCGAHVK